MKDVTLLPLSYYAPTTVFPPSKLTLRVHRFCPGMPDSSIAGTELDRDAEAWGYITMVGSGDRHSVAASFCHYISACLFAGLCT